MPTGDESDASVHDRAGEPDEHHVVTVFLRNAGDVLLLKRSDAVGTYARSWGAVSGYAEGDPEAAARWEIDEETGLLDHVTVVRQGAPLAFTDDELKTRWVVHPFLFDSESRAVRPNEEIADVDWCPPTEILRRETVPRLWDAYDRVRPTVETIAEDTTHGSAWLSLRALEVLRDAAGEVTVELISGVETEGLNDLARRLLAARPSMTALTNRVNRVMSESENESESAESVERVATEALVRAVDADRQAAAEAATRLPEETVLTLSRSGTVGRALTEGRPAHVYVAESRPAREGVGVAERLAEANIDVTLITDAAVAHVLGGALEPVDRVLVGADTVFPDGSVLNKTGTRGAAIVAAREGIDVDVVTAADKVAADELDGDVTGGEDGAAEELYDGDAAIAVENPTFDRTPARFVTRVVTERGALGGEAVRAVATEHRELARWAEDA